MKISIIGSTHNEYVAPKEDFEILSGHAGGVCYMPGDFDSLLNEPLEKTIKRANMTKRNEHHSVFEHPTINLLLENIPKGLAMVLNNEHTYTTSEKSARYTKMQLSEKEQALYDKWLETYKCLIKEKYQEKFPQFFSDSRVEKLAQENARYLISVFTPTTMVYSVSYRQLNYLYQMIKNEIENGDSNEFMTELKPAMQDFLNAIEKTGYIDEDITKAITNKNRKLSLIGKTTTPEEYFGDVYSTNYLGSFAQLAQAQRHRTLNYNMTLLDEPKFYVPPIIRESDQLTSEWTKDCESQVAIFPQGMLVNINECGTMDWFIQKMKERKCSFAQLEINQQTSELAKKYMQALEEKKHARYKEMAEYTKGSRCTFPDYKCTSPCMFTDGVIESRLI